MTGVRPMPPPTSTRKPKSPAAFLTRCRPTSCQNVAARSSTAPLTAILNLRGRKANSGCSVLHWRMISQYGRGSARSEERRVGKECRSRCDWSSDVCSSDLDGTAHGDLELARKEGEFGMQRAPLAHDFAVRAGIGEIGRASCRERV